MFGYANIGVKADEQIVRSGKRQNDRMKNCRKEKRGKYCENIYVYIDISFLAIISAN